MSILPKPMRSNGSRASMRRREPACSANRRRPSFIDCPIDQQRNRHEAQHRSIFDHAYRESAAPQDCFGRVRQAGRGAGHSAALAGASSPRSSEVARKQAAAGIDVVDNGEMSKPSNGTSSRIVSGFGGAGNTFVYQDQAGTPILPARVRRSGLLAKEDPRVQRRDGRARRAGSVVGCRASRTGVETLKEGLWMAASPAPCRAGLTLPG